MPNTSNTNQLSPFKPYLGTKQSYKGGKAVHEVGGDPNKKIYKLSSNENPIGPSPKAMEALRASLHDLHIYPERTTIRLQEALSQFYGGALEPDHFIAANSGSEVLEHIIRAFLGEGQECIISNPCFHPYHMFSGWQGAKVVDVPLLAPDFSLDVAGILSKVNDQTRLIFLTSPNNPTGSYIPTATLDHLFNELPEHVIVVLDEVYYHFATAEDFSTALPYVHARKNIIGLNSFSKTYGLAGIRAGYAYSTPEIAAYVRNLSKPFLINTLTLNAAIAALEDEAFLRQTVELVQGERERLYPQLDKLPIQYWKSQSNFILVKAQLDPAEMEQRLLQEGIMVRNATNFGAPGCFRVTIGNGEANDAMIQALTKVLQN